MSSSIRDKTIRPGSLKGYSYYYSGKSNKKPPPASKQPKKSYKKLVLASLLVIVLGFWLGSHGTDNEPMNQSTGSSSQQGDSASQAIATNMCADNQLDKLIKISIDKRKLWACQKSTSVYSAPVITGLKNHAETETPLGTYKVYAKTTDTRLTGNDSRGAWDYPVHYWMPFLDNQYGTYGFHDATWRSSSDFGKISPDSDKASHGCVELPLAAMKWLYEWAPAGTTLDIIS